MVAEIRAGKRTRKELEPWIAGWSIAMTKEESHPSFGGRKYVQVLYTFMVGWYGSLDPETLSVSYLEDGGDFIIVGMTWSGHFRYTYYVITSDGIRKQ